MSRATVPGFTPEAHRLLVRSLGSIDALDVALLLSRSADTFWTTSAIAQQLGMSQDVVVKAVEALVAAELVVRGRETVAYRFAPKRDDDREAMAALAQAYATDRAAVVNALYSANLNSIRAFADSFRFKKE